MKKNITGKKVLTCSMLLVIVICFTGCSKKSDLANLSTEYVSASYVVNMDEPEEVVGLCNNVFVGYIEEMIDTYYDLALPLTRYNVRVIKDIKGDLPTDTTVQVNKEGGISEDGSYYILFEDDFLPDEGGCYIFNVLARKEDNSYTASGVNTVISINDIDIQNLTNDTNSNKSNNLESIKRSVINKLDDSGIYLKYVDAYKNQKPFDPKQ